MRYYIHLQSHVEEIWDSEGVSLSSVDELKKIVVQSARAIMADDIKIGILDLRYCIEARDDQGVTVLTLPFRNAVSIIPAE